MADLQPGQFSQPHLPGLHVKPTDQHRYQRGFTPDRKREVDDAFGKNVLIANQKAGGSEDPSSQGAFAGHLASNSIAPWMGRKEGVAKVKETIARSTIDLAPMSGKNAPMIHSAQRKDTYDSAGLYTAGPTQYGGRSLVQVFSDPTYAAAPTKPMTAKSAAPTVTRDLRQSNEQTLLHELGHHASNLQGTQEYDTPAARGKEEAFADDFSAKHFRPDPRDARRGQHLQGGYDASGKRPQDPQGSGGWGGSEEEQAADDEFSDTYLAHRQFPGKYVDRTSGPKRPTYPSGITKLPGDPDIEGQGRLFMRQGRDAKDTTPDYGQHPLMDNDKQPLKTIKLGRGVRG